MPTLEKDNKTTYLLLSVCIYADDVILYREINSCFNFTRGFIYYNSFDSRLVSATKSKCEHFTITTKRNLLTTAYQLNDQTLHKLLKQNT